MKWRTIFTDSESETGIAPECARQSEPNGPHRITDGPPVADTKGVYDCCPHPHIECYGEASAQALAVFLTALGAEPCS